MKETLLVPIKYLLVYVLVALILTLGVYVYSWCENPLPLAGGMHDHADLIFRGLYAVMVPASLVALVILILMLQRGKGIPWLLFLAMWLSFSGLLFVQITILRPYRPLPPRTAAPVEIPKRIHSYQEGAVYIEESFSQGTPAVIMSVSGNPRLSAGKINKVSEEIVRVEKTLLTRAPKNPFFNEALQIPPIISAIFRDFKVLSAFFAFTHSSSSTRAVLTIASFGFLISSCWIFGRFTSWPLLNTVYLLFVLRIAVLLSALMLSPATQELFQAFVPGIRISDFAHYVYAAGGLLLVLWDLVFIPFHRFPEKGRNP